MAVDLDARRLEAELKRIFRKWGVRTEDDQGVEYIGICSATVTDSSIYVASMPERSQVVPLNALAQDILEALR